MRSLAYALVLCLLAPSAAAQDDARAEAEALYRQGLARYDAGDYEEALAAFTAARRHLTTPNLLYALGRAHMRLDEAGGESAVDHRVRALGYLEQYAATPELAAPRRAEVDGWIAALAARVGTLWVETNVEGAVILLRGVETATSPMSAPLRVSAGSLRVTARATGHDVATREVTIAGGETLHVRLELRPLVERRGSVRVSSTLEAVEVRLDGAFVGTTPMTETVLASPGPHVVEGRRDGYEPTRVDIVVRDGADTEVALALRPAADAPASAMGLLMLDTPSPRQVWVDGEEMPSEGALRLPRGPHRVRIEVAEREPIELAVSLEAQTVLQPRLRWDPGARAARLTGREAQTIAGVVLLGGGVALGGATAGFHAWAEGEHGDAAQLEPMIDFCNAVENRGSLECSLAGGWNQDEAVARFNDSAEDLNVRRSLALVGYVVAIGLVTTGVVLLLTTGSEQDVDAGAELRLRLGPASVALAGDF